MRVKANYRVPARGPVGPAPAAPTSVELRDDQVACPECGKPVRFRVAGPLASTLFGHKNSGIPCKMGTPASIYGIEVV